MICAPVALAKLHEFRSHQTSDCLMTSFSSAPVKCRRSRSAAFS
jgi:hypothetical protein